MDTRLFISCIIAGAMAVAGCKTDSEDDIPGWGDTDGGDDSGTVTTPPTGGVVINEICGKQSPDDDWLELYNTGTEAADLSGARIVKTDEDGKDEDVYTFPSGSSIAAGSYRVVATLTGELTAGISNSKQVGLTLVSADGTVLDKFDRDGNVGKDLSHKENGSYARIPDGTGQWTVTETATRGQANR